MMDDVKQTIEELEQKRDELAVQIKLGSMEAKDEWEKLEAKWNDFSAKARLDQSAEGVGGAIKDLGDELMKGYERLKKVL